MEVDTACSSRPSTSAAAAPKPFLAALTGVRAFAAFWVLAMHVFAVLGTLVPAPIAPILGFVTRPGFLGVDVFFVLSGFIISYNYAHVFAEGFDLSRWGRFLWARLARIYPVHFVLLVALAVAVLGLGFGHGGQIEEERWSIRGLLTSLLLIHAWVGDKDVWNAVSWSISAEWLAYLCFPLLSAIALAITRRLGPRAAWGVLMMAAAVQAMYATANRYVGYSLPALPALQIVGEFLAGCMTFRIFAGQRGTPRVAAYPGAILLTLTVVAASFARFGVPPHWAVVLVPPMLLGLAGQRGRLSRILSHPWTVYWGKVSFALYMTHYLWLWVIQTAVPVSRLATYDVAWRIGFGLLYVLPPFVIAMATYQVIEEPARRRIAGIVRRPATAGRDAAVRNTAMGLT
jgi:peptidoglycan/LPS O-acetylase OafA/YrhL